MHKLLFFLVSLLFSSSVQSQNRAVGYWTDHLPYRSVKKVVFAGDKVIGTTGHSLITYDLEDNSIERISRINGLSEVSPQALAYSQKHDKVLVGHADGSLDIMQDGRVNSYFDIKRSSILGSKAINDIQIVGDTALIACGFGVVVLNIPREIILDTWIIGDNESSINIHSVFLHETAVFACTENGVLQSSLSSSNVRNFLGWDLVPSDSVLNPRIDFIFSFSDTLIGVAQNKIFRSDTCFYLDESTNRWKRFKRFDGEDVNGIAINESGELVVANSTSVEVYDTGWNNIRRVFSLPENKSVNPNAVAMANGIIAIADNFQGLAINYAPFNSEVINPPSPAAASSNKINITNNQVHVATGRNRAGFQAFQFYVNRSGEWENYLYEDLNFDTLSVFNAMSVAADPQTDNKFYVGSNINGVIEITNGSATAVYNSSNSDLPQVADPSVDYTRITEVRFDSEGILWTSNSETDRLISARKRDGEWVSFTPQVSLPTNLSLGMEIDQFGNKWVILEQGGILVFNDNGELDNPAEHEYRHLGTSENSGNLAAIGVSDLVEDKNGEIWIATDEGISVVFNPASIFNSSTNAQRIFIQQDGYTQYLFEGQRVTSIAVNGANQKWIAIAGAGVFLMSEDGTEEILHFTKETHPLFSNNISDIAVRPSYGEVFFSTEAGLISYRGGVTETESTYDNLFVYPNPVTKEHVGPVAIDGMVENSTVFITTVSGDLVYKQEVQGGQFLWNRSDLNGDEVSAGVYLVYCTDATGSQSGVTKVLLAD